MTGEPAGQPPPAPPPLPLAFLLATLTPTLLVLALVVAESLGGAPAPSRGTLALFWAFSTLPLLMVALGLRHALSQGALLMDPQVRKVLASLAKTEQAATEAVQALVRFKAAQDAAAAPPPAPAKETVETLQPRP